MKNDQFHTCHAAVYPRAADFRSGTWGRTLLVTLPGASLACRDAGGRQRSLAQFPSFFLKKETLRKNQKSSKNQHVDSNLRVCDVTDSMPKTGKSSTITSRRDGPVMSAQKESGAM